MKATTTEAYTTAIEAALAMKAEGKSNKEVMAATGLSHSQLENAIMRVEFADQLWSYDSDTKLTAMIVKARAEGKSWGVIAILASAPEGRVRKLFTAATAIDHKGLRIGKGGRFVADAPEFYTGSDRAKAGKEFDPARSIWEQVPAIDDEEVRRLPEAAKAAEKALKPKRVRKATAKA